MSLHQVRPRIWREKYHNFGLQFISKNVAQNLQPDPFLLAKPWLPGSSKQPPKSSGPTWHITTSPLRAVRGCVHWRKGEGETVDGVTVDFDDDDDDDGNNADSDNSVLIILLNIIENH